MNDQPFSASSAGSDGPTPFGEIRLGSGKRQLVASNGALSIGDQVFRLDGVDRVVYRSAARINQASYTIGVAQGAEKHTFMVDAYKRGTELDDTRNTWQRFVALLEATACPRIAQDAVQIIASGGTFTFGGPLASRIDADAEGLRPRHLFAKRIPWSRIVDADLGNGLARVWTSTDGVPDPKPRLSIDMSGWNAVILPRVVALLREGGRE